MRAALLVAAGAGIAAALALAHRAELVDVAEPGAELEELVGMTPHAAELAAIAQEANVAAFLAMLTHGEGTAGPNGYRTLYGGGLFDHFADHPRIPVRAVLGGRVITSTAAGRYQFLARTWDGVRDALDLPDFSPASQDVAAVYLIRRRGALEDVRAGRFDDAVRKCAKEWASLPGSPYGQPVVSIDRARALYAASGGVLA
jgi:muramidase (phage lysozyme)